MEHIADTRRWTGRPATPTRPIPAGRAWCPPTQARRAW